MQVARWGNSLAIRLPKKLVEEMGLEVGDRVELRPLNEGLGVLRAPTPEETLKALRRFRGRLPATEGSSRDEANAR